LKYAIKDLILALGEEKAYFECHILFPQKENYLIRVKYSLKVEAGIVSHTKSSNSLINALAKFEAEHMPDIFGK
jgi:hypothetical protein